MNNFEMHEKATELSDSVSPYMLARMVVELQDKVEALQVELIVAHSGCCKKGVIFAGA